MSESSEAVAKGRLFVGLPMAANVRRQLVERLPSSALSKLSGNIHLTLRFIGEVGPLSPYMDQLAGIRCSRFNLHLGTPGFLRGNIYYISPDPNYSLKNLKSHIDAMLGRLGLPAEPRPFLPHITLCRFRHKTSAAQREKLCAIDVDLPWHIDSFCLFRSHLTHLGARHEVLKRYDLV